MKMKIIVPVLFIIMIVTSIAIIKGRHITHNDLFTQNLEALTSGEHEQNLVSCVLKVEWVKDKKSYDIRYCTGCFYVPATNSSNESQCIINQ